MYWLKLFAKIAFLVTPVFLLIAGGIMFLVLPTLDPLWSPLLFVAAPLALLVANWIWPLKPGP